MRKRIVSIVFCTALLMLSASDVFACSCVRQKPVEEVYEYNSAIFSGTVTGVKPGSKYRRKIAIKVEKSWKGRLPKTVTISTMAVDSLCGYNFVVGKRYLIYADGAKANGLFTDICSRTKTLSAAKADLKILNDLTAKAAAKTKPSPK